MAFNLPSSSSTPSSKPGSSLFGGMSSLTPTNTTAPTTPNSFGVAAPSPFGAAAPNPFGAAAPSPFGAVAPSPFGSKPQNPSPLSLFGSTAPAVPAATSTLAQPFGTAPGAFAQNSSTTTGSSLFGNSSTFGGGTKPFGGAAPLGGTTMASAQPSLTPQSSSSTTALPALTLTSVGGSTSNLSGGGSLFGTPPPAAPSSPFATASSSSSAQTSTPTAPAPSFIFPNQPTAPSSASPFPSVAAASASPAAPQPPPQQQQQPVQNMFGNVAASSNSTMNPTPPAPSSTAPAAQPQSSLFPPRQPAPTSGFSSLPVPPVPSTSSAQTSKLSSIQPAPLFSGLSSVSSLSSSIFGKAGQQQQQQQTVPGVKIDLTNMKATTRFSELHDDLQSAIGQYDDFIQSQISLFNQCAAFMPGHGMHLKVLPADVDVLENMLETVTLALDRDAAEISGVKELVHTDIEDARRTFSAIETLKLPAQFQYSIAYDGNSKDPDHPFAASDLTPYFEQRINQLEARLQTYNQQLGELEAHLNTISNTAAEQSNKLLRRQAGEDPSKERIKELGTAMTFFEDAVLRVASRVGESREAVIELAAVNPSTISGIRKPAMF